MAAFTASGLQSKPLAAAAETRSGTDLVAGAVAEFANPERLAAGWLPMPSLITASVTTLA